LIELLIESQNLDLVSHHLTGQEFLETRRLLYAHDAARYAMYFDERQDRQMPPTRFKSAGTTESLAQVFESSLDVRLGASERDRLDLPDQVLRPIELALRERGERAMTFSLFRPYAEAQAETIVQIGALRRAISLSYCEHYLDFADGNIPTGVRGLNFFDDHLPRGFPSADIPLCFGILQRLGFTELLGASYRSKRAFWEALAYARLSGTSLAYELQLLLRCSSIAAEGLTTQASGLYSHRAAVAGFCRKWLADLDSEFKSDEGSLIERAGTALHRLRLRREMDPLWGPWIELEKRWSSRRTDLLVVTATDIETSTFREVVERQFGLKLVPEEANGLQFNRVGTIGATQVVHVRCETGSSGPRGSMLSIFEAITLLNPELVVMIGIAFGVDRRKQPIGTVMVSERLFDYNIVRVNTTDEGGVELEARGDRVPADGYLVDQCRRVSQSWRTGSVQIGLIASGAALVDNESFRDEIVRLSSGQAIGGEMEGVGLYSAAMRRRKAWILVKAVCDWADGRKGVNKTRKQRRAAERSSEFVCQVLATSSRAGLGLDGQSRRLG